jgi:hypothetical protein
MGTLSSISEYLQSASCRSKIRTARALADERRRGGAERRFATAHPALDRLLAGGLERGATIELVGGRSSGRFAVVMSVLAAVTGTGEAAALIDLGDGFDPRTAEAAGVDLARLLWVRPRRMKDVLASAEVILGTGIPFVVVELGMPPLIGGRGAEAAWLRLARLARAHRAALLVASPYRASGTSAQVVLELPRARPRWNGDGPRLLQGIDATVELVKSRRAEHRGLGHRHLSEAVSWSVGGPTPLSQRSEERRAVA